MGLSLDEEVYDRDTNARPVALQGPPGSRTAAAGTRPERRGDVLTLSGVSRSRGCCWVRAPWPRQTAG